MTSTAHQHSVSTARFAGRVIVKAAGETVADSRDAVVLHEDGYKPVFYVPKSDVRKEQLQPTEHTNRCLHKGAARYWTLKVGERTIENAAWAYDEPLSGAADIAGLVAFYPDKVDVIEATGL
ncbi:MAG TPA: DUF427 domain-containing protein [Aestuariivirgaceae bacterium]|nr:DUF427 domain-containing protein [Aestuariivirgaceae bacterium]